MAKVSDLPQSSQATVDSLRAVTGGRVSLLNFIPKAEHAAIYAGTSTYDCLPALALAIASVTANTTLYNEGGPRIYCAPGSYFFNGTIELKKTVIIEGDAVGMAGGYAARFLFPANSHGIIIHRYNTIGDGVQDPAQKGADGSIIRCIELRGNATGATGHGIWMRARATLQNLTVTGFKQNGVNIVAGAGIGGADEGNANCWRADTITTVGNGGHGFFTDGADANAGLATNIDSRANGGWGIYDSSFLGNTYVGCHVDANAAGSYQSDNANAKNCLIGCYSEGGHPASRIMAPAMVVGGAHGAGFTADTSGFVLDSLFSSALLTAFSVKAKTGSSNDFTVNFGQQVDDACNLTAVGDGAGGFAPLTWDNTAGCWVTRHRRVGNRTPVHYTTDLNTLSCGRSAPLGGGQVVFGQGIWLGSSTATANYHGSGTAAPAAGEWARGDTIHNTAPSAGGFAGWICTTAGTPGTWKGYGAIEP